jgi:hypothetical protein
LKKLDEEDWTFLSTDECIKIINSFEDNKSPGIDGLGKSFYSRFWLILGKDLVEVLNNIYLQGELIKVLTKLPNSEQSYKGKVKTHNYINRQNQSTTGKL